MSDELSAALRELAADQGTPPTVDGAAIRARATRRRRRRRVTVTLGAGTLALVVLGLALNLNSGGAREHPPGSRVPATTYSAPTPTPTPTPTPEPVAGTLDLRGGTLTVDGRALPVVSRNAAPTEFTGPLTVVAKQNPRQLTFEVPSKGPAYVSVPYVVELRDSEGRSHYIGQYVPQLKVLSDYEAQGGLIALDIKDAEWFHGRIRIGDTISVTAGARQGTRAAEPTDGARSAEGARTADPTASVSVPPAPG
ncbi:hypothetical protein [Streptomyces lanatus]|uniref:Uncharacterized protein n=1 Tax=Streptomyces lanatus TaxID=66900 RepID=A0ABV1XRS2_9ACTN|nr:hypothetical protein [Streptomyces lanatus]GHH04627.1 hypothetical protein GCM10018780_35280 [Streptomyces lanatus]